MNARRLAAGLLLLLTACGPVDTSPRPPGRTAAPYAPTQDMLDAAARRIGEIRGEFLAWYFEAHPVRASELGVHDYDARLPDLSRTGVQDRIDALLDWIRRLENLRFDLVQGESRYDYAVLEWGLRGQLLALEEVRDWANDPRIYTSTIARGLTSVAQWEYAPLPERIASLNARMAAAPALLQAARANVTNPPRLWTELAVADARGLLTYLETGLPARIAAQAGADSAAALQNLDDQRAALSEALRTHVDWLQDDLLPRAGGSFRLGRYLLARQLRFEEHLSLDVDELERINRNGVVQYRQRADALARRLDPNRSTRAVMDSIGSLHPAPEDLIGTAREMMEVARAWTEESDVLDIPDAPSPTVRESPPFARDVFSSLNASAPLGEEPWAAFFNLTNVQPDWPEELAEEHLAHFSYAGILSTALYETYPGKYVYALYTRELSPLRRVFLPRSVSGGWAHYAAEMAMEQGLTDDPAVQLIQIRRGLQRHARWHAVIQLHARNAPLDQVVGEVMEMAYMDEFPARREVVRAAREPTYLADALGRMQILEVLEDYREYREAREETFSLAQFHTELLQLGLPFPLAREVLMPPEPSRRRP